MPDHVHLVLQVMREMPCHLGNVISGLKAGIRKDLRDDSFETEPRTAPTALLWEAGYNDTILQGPGQLKAMINYVHDNPRRLWLRRQHNDLFVIRSTMIGDVPVKVMGNLSLLQARHKLQVRCSRRMSQNEIERECARVLEATSQGGVAVSPAISPGEKAIMRRVFDAGHRVIVLLENGFSINQKPCGRQFEACVEERLLLVAPWEHHNDRRAITRQQCESLNSLAAAICATP